MPSPTYSGDFETTAIPPYDPAGSHGSGSGAAYPVAGPEPLPYSQPQPVGPRPAGGTGADSADSADTDSPFRAADRRGTQDLGLLILRAAFGALLVAYGLRKLFGWWGGQGLNEFRSALTGAGYQHIDILTYVGAGGQIAAGLLLVLGLFTPLAAAGALAYYLNAVLAGVSAHTQDRFAFFLPEGHEHHLMLIVVAVAIILVGPGRYGLDGDRGWARRPFIGSFAALLLGVGGGIAMWVLLNGANPLG